MGSRGQSENLYAAFLEVEATCQELYRDLEAAVEELAAVRAEAEARLERLNKALGWAEQLAGELGKEVGVEMGLHMEEQEAEHAQLGGRTGKLDAAIARAQVAMANPRLDSSNPAFRGSRFASLAEVRNAVVPALAKEGVSVTQHPTFADGRLRLRTRLAGYGEVLESVLDLKVSRDDPQGVGSAITYARRYALAAIACVAGDDDDDGNAAVGRPEGPQTRPDGVQATPLAKTPQKPSTGQPEASAGALPGKPPESPEVWEGRIAAAKDAAALARVGTELTKAPRDTQDWVRDKYLAKMAEFKKQQDEKGQPKK